MKKRKQSTKRVVAAFSPEETDELPIAHANAILVQTGVDEFIITIGVAMPPEDDSGIPLYVPAEAERERVIVPAKPLTRFALSRDSMRRFIETMDFFYGWQIDLEEKDTKEAVQQAKEEKS